MNDRVCESPGCERPAQHGRLCFAHRKQLQRNGRLGGEVRERDGASSLERVAEAVLKWQGADLASDFERATARLWRAMEDAMLRRGWKPPRPGQRNDVPDRGDDSAADEPTTERADDHGER